MKEQHAQPGDTIEITIPGLILSGKEFIVIECPKPYLHWNVSGNAWIEEPNVDRQFFPADCYKIVSRPQKQAQVESSVDASLDRQRDDNLRLIFG